MGTFKVQVSVGNIEDGELTPVLATVDTGATHSMMPSSLMQHHHVRSFGPQQYVLGDGNTKEFEFGIALFQLNGENWPCPVLFGAEGLYLLGATALEIFRLVPDPINKELVPQTWIARPF